MKQSKGFTLLELMIVIAIIGIVASIAIPAYTGYIKTARISEAKTNIAALKLAQEEYFLENNNYFEGANAGEIKTNSGSLWAVTAGESGTPLFDYAVTASTTGYTATATGKAGSSVDGEVETYTK